eukprot:UN23201
MLLNILFVFSKQGSTFKYRQGMNELLAPILMVNATCCDAIEKNFKKDHPLRVACDPKYIEHDTYWMFHEITKNLLKYFYHDGKSEHPIVQKCKYIQNKLLRKLDPELSNHLVKIQVEPQLYGLRWFRLFLTREFHIDDVCHLWDAILAE